LSHIPDLLWRFFPSHVFCPQDSADILGALDGTLDDGTLDVGTLDVGEGV